MKEAQIIKFLELLHIITNSSGTWQEKKAKIEAQACEGDMNNIEEFVAWYDQAE